MVLCLMLNLFSCDVKPFCGFVVKIKKDKKISMPTFEIKMPKLGESVEEATITKWFVKENDVIQEEQALLEIATDKVDSEIPSPVDGKVLQILFKENEKVAVGKTIATIDMGGEASSNIEAKIIQKSTEQSEAKSLKEETKTTSNDFSGSSRFYSPLVKSISQKENISLAELDKIAGSGKDGRVRKNDVLSFLENRGNKS